jgi:3-isopropylmalate dehydrogenase
MANLSLCARIRETGSTNSRHWATQGEPAGGWDWDRPHTVQSLPPRSDEKPSMSSLPVYEIAVIPGDGIGIEVVAAARSVLDAVQRRSNRFRLDYVECAAGARLYAETGQDMSAETELACDRADAILLGAIGDPAVRHADGTEIAPHLRLRERYGLYGGIRPAKAYPNITPKLADPRAAEIDLIILRESTEGLFYSYGRGEVIDDREARETLRITRATTEKLHDLAFRLAAKRKARGGKGRVTCVDKANVFASMAFFRKIFDERAAAFPDIDKDYCYVDAQALNLVRQPWEADVLVMENMFGDILSDLAGALVGGMGMAACGELGDEQALFQPAHGSAPDIAGQDKANPMATVLSTALMLDYMADKRGDEHLAEAALCVERAVQEGFDSGRLRPMELGGDQGTREVTDLLVQLVEEGA